MITRSRHVEGKVLDDDIFLCLDASTTVASGNDVKGALTREYEFAFRPNDRSLMVDSIVTSSDGEGILRTFGSHHLHSFRILQMEWSTLLTGQVQAIEFYLRLSSSFQDELSVVALALQ